MLVEKAFFSTLLLTVLSARLSVEENASSEATLRPFEPTREELYRQFAQELQVVAGAEEHTKQVYHSTTVTMRQSVSYAVLDKLQALMDSVGSVVEDVLAIAENDGTTTSVTSCTAGKDLEAENVVKSALDGMRHCVEKLTVEGDDLAHQAARLVSQVEDLLKQLVTAFQECLPAKKDSPEDEREQVKKCFVSEPVKELISRKESAFKSLKIVMNKVFNTEKQPPDCISKLFQKAEDEILEMKNTITNCAKKTARVEL